MKKSDKDTKLKQIGEFGLIDLLRKNFASKGKRIILGIGDDASVIKVTPQKYLILTTDALVEGVHFDLGYTTFHQLGWKAMTANLSDIAAMGGLPICALVTLGLTPNQKVKDILSLYKGMSEVCQKFRCVIVGGDITSVSKGMFISVALSGEVEPEFLTTRAKARIGDLIYVTGELGEVETGLELLKKNKKIKKTFLRSKISEKLLTPLPRIKEGRILVENLKISSMIDISDGLSSDLYHIAEESRVGVLIYQDLIPISPKVLKIAPLLPKSPLSLALNSGEEYELIFTINEKQKEKLDKLKKRFKKLVITQIGEITPQSQGVRIQDKTGRIKKLKKEGWVHF